MYLATTSLIETLFEDFINFIDAVLQSAVNEVITTLRKLLKEKVRRSKTTSDVLKDSPQMLAFRKSIGETLQKLDVDLNSAELSVFSLTDFSLKDSDDEASDLDDSSSSDDSSNSDVTDKQAKTHPIKVKEEVTENSET